MVTLIPVSGERDQHFAIVVVMDEPELRSRPWKRVSIEYSVEVAVALDRSHSALLKVGFG